MSDRARVVLDTNVLVSALMRPGSPPGLALSVAGAQMELVASLETLGELRNVLEREKFDRYVDRETRRRFVARYVIDALLVDPVEPVRICRDPKDDMFLALAMAAGAVAIVSGDPHLLECDDWKGIRVCAPIDFLKQYGR